MLKELEETGEAAWMNQDDAVVAKAPAKGGKRKRATKKDTQKDVGSIAEPAKTDDAGSEGEEPTKKKPARAKGVSKPVKSAAIVKSDDEDDEAVDAVAKVESKPTKKGAPTKSKAKTTAEPKATSAATDADEAEDAPTATVKKAAKTKPAAVKKPTKKDATTIELADVKVKNIKRGAEGAKKSAPVPTVEDADENDD